MTMTDTRTPTDIFTGNSTLPAAPAMREIRCVGKRRDGEKCNKLLLRVDPDLVVSPVAAGVQMRCPNCGSVYSLADACFKVLT